MDDRVNAPAEPAARDRAGQLLIKIAAGSRDALGGLYDLLSPRVFGLAMAIDPDRADDILQDTFLLVSRTAVVYDPETQDGRDWVMRLAAAQAGPGPDAEDTRLARVLAGAGEAAPPLAARSRLLHAVSSLASPRPALEAEPEPAVERVPTAIPSFEAIIAVDTAGAATVDETVAAPVDELYELDELGDETRPVAVAAPAVADSPADDAAYVGLDPEVEIDVEPVEVEPVEVEPAPVEPAVVEPAPAEPAPAAPAPATVAEVAASDTSPTSVVPSTDVIQTIERRRWIRGLTATVGIIVLLVTMGWVAGALADAFGRPEALVALDEIGAASDGVSVEGELPGGSASVAWSDDLGKTVLVVTGLPEIAAGEVFQAWFLRDQTPYRAGMFTAADGSATVLLDDQREAGDVIVVSVEPATGSPSGGPSGEPVLTIDTTSASGTSSG